MPKDASRESHFPAIEKKYGEKMAYWFKVMAKIEGKKYPEQIAHLKENYGFSQAHANALVMYSRGSVSSRRFATPADYFKSIDPQQSKTIKAIFKAIKAKHPELELVIAWNVPMLKKDTHYLFGVSTSKNHISIAPWDQDVLKAFAPKFAEYKVLKKTIQIPNDWDINASNAKLLQGMITASLKALK
jgi:uncharacterized protein YdhG (YjbR/CyaY superfamily)